MEYKFSTVEAGAEEGTIGGYGSVFGNMDANGDIIAPGAFTETLATARQTGRWPSMLYHHGGMHIDTRWELPVGAWNTIEEDAVGLRVEGKLALNTPDGAALFALVNMKPRPALNGLSIGFRTRSAIPGQGAGAPRRTINRVDLVEISLVRDPANAIARIDSVKSALADLGTMQWRALEAGLRDAGLSRGDSVKAVAAFKEYLRRDAGGPEQNHRDDGEAALIQERLLHLANLMRA